LIITAESNLPVMVTPGIHKTGALKKKTTTSG